MIAVITTLNAQVKILEEQVSDHFGRHPDAETCKSQSGLAAIFDARVLGEVGDDPRWYVSAKGRKDYGGTSPNTGAPGKKPAALGLLTRTLTERERSQGARHAQTMATRAQLATALLEAGRVKRVVFACGVRTGSWAPITRDTLARRVRLANPYYSADRPGVAGALLRDASGSCPRRHAREVA